MIDDHSNGGCWERRSIRKEWLVSPTEPMPTKYRSTFETYCRSTCESALSPSLQHPRSLVNGGLSLFRAARNVLGLLLCDDCDRRSEARQTFLHFTWPLADPRMCGFPRPGL